MRANVALLRVPLKLQWLPLVKEWIQNNRVWHTGSQFIRNILCFFYLRLGWFLATWTFYILCKVVNWSVLLVPQSPWVGLDYRRVVTWCTGRRSARWSLQLFASSRLANRVAEWTSEPHATGHPNGYKAVLALAFLLEYPHRRRSHIPTMKQTRSNVMESNRCMMLVVTSEYVFYSIVHVTSKSEIIQNSQRCFRQIRSIKLKIE